MLKPLLLTSLLLLSALTKAQSVSAVYSVNDLLSRLNHKDTVYVVNFWATWCKPCVAELPALDSLNHKYKGSKVKVLLVCLDFREELQTKVNPFLKRKNLSSECVLLDEVDGNAYIDKISPNWSGAIPATLFKSGDKKQLVQKKMNLSMFEDTLAKLN